MQHPVYSYCSWDVRIKKTPHQHTTFIITRTCSTHKDLSLGVILNDPVHVRFGQANFIFGFGSFYRAEQFFGLLFLKMSRGKIKFSLLVICVNAFLLFWERVEGGTISWCVWNQIKYVMHAQNLQDSRWSTGWLNDLPSDDHDSLRNKLRGVQKLI